MKSETIAFYILLILLIPFSLTYGEMQEHPINKILLSEEAEWAPFTYEDGGTPKKGLSLEVMTLIFSRLNIEINFKLYPMNRCIRQMKNGRRDAITMISKNSDREAFLDFTDPVVTGKGRVWYLSDRSDKIEWTQFADLKKYRIGVVQGYNYGNPFKKASVRYDFDLMKVIKTEQLFRILLGKRVDIILSQETEGYEFFRKYSDKKKLVLVSKKPYTTYEYHVGFSKKSRAGYLIPEINRIIEIIKKDGTLRIILNKYNMDY